MPCRKCQCDTTVTDSRPTVGTIRRRRKCLSCGHRFTTFEYTEDDMSEQPLVQAVKSMRKLRDDAEELYGLIVRQVANSEIVAEHTPTPP